MSPLWDFLVAGAGPAGSRAAEMLAARGASVILLDAARGLEHTPELHELTDRGEIVSEVLVVAPRGTGVVVPLRTPFWMVSRLTLSRIELERARAAGVRLLQGTVYSAERSHGLWRVRDSAGAVHRARFVVAADGASGWLRGRMAPELTFWPTTTRPIHSAAGPRMGRAALFLLPEGEGCAWAFPHTRQERAGMVSYRSIFGRRISHTASAPCLRARTNERIPSGLDAVMATWHWDTESLADVGSEDFALLGDAAGFANPLARKGLDHALRSAVLAVQSFDEQSGFAGYPDRARRAFAVDIGRAGWLRKWFRRGHDRAEELVRRARRIPRWTLLLMSMLEAVNEDRSLKRAFCDALFAGALDRSIARAVCESPDDAGPGAPQGYGVSAGMAEPGVQRST